MKKGRILLKGFFYVFLVLILGAVSVRPAMALCTPAYDHTTGTSFQLCEENITGIKLHTSDELLKLDASGIAAGFWKNLVTWADTNIFEKFQVFKGLRVGQGKNYCITISGKSYCTRPMGSYGKFYVYADTGKLKPDGTTLWHQIPSDWCNWIVTSGADKISVQDDKPGTIFGNNVGMGKVTCELKFDRAKIDTSDVEVRPGWTGGAYISYWYNDVENYFYTEPNPWQRSGGFNRLYDLGAQAFNMNYDTIRIKFTADYYTSATNKQTRDWMIQLWKGTYGIFPGGEIGLYNGTDSRLLTRAYKCNDDLNLLNMSMTLYQHKNRGAGQMEEVKLFTTPDDDYWWITGFKGWYDEYNKKDIASAFTSLDTILSAWAHLDSDLGLNRYIKHPNGELTLLARITIPSGRWPLMDNKIFNKLTIKTDLKGNRFEEVSVNWANPREDHKNIRNWPDTGNTNQIVKIGRDIYIRWNYYNDGVGLNNW